MVPGDTKAEDNSEAGDKHRQAENDSEAVSSESAAGIFPWEGQGTGLEAYFTNRDRTENEKLV